MYIHIYTFTNRRQVSLDGEMLRDGVLYTEDQTVNHSRKETFIPSELKLATPTKRIAWGYLSFAVF